MATIAHWLRARQTPLRRERRVSEVEHDPLADAGSQCDGGRSRSPQLGGELIAGLHWRAEAGADRENRAGIPVAALADDGEGRGAQRAEAVQERALEAGAPCELRIHVNRVEVPAQAVERGLVATAAPARAQVGR